MNYELCKKLKDAGFPQEPRISTGGVDGEVFGGFYHVGMIDGDGAFGYFTVSEYEEYLKRDSTKHVIAKAPTLSELIEACGERFDALQSLGGRWGARASILSAEGSTPEEAVANLWLALQESSKMSK